MPKMENQLPNVVRVRLVTTNANPDVGLVLTSRPEPPRTAVRALVEGSEAKRCGLIHPGIFASFSQLCVRLVILVLFLVKFGP